MTAALPMPVEQLSRVEQARAEMLTALVDELNRSGLPYCLLSGFHAFPMAAVSDMDFMVRPCDSGRVVALLQRAARRCDALLVQAMQHETEAWYFVLAKQVESEVAYLHPDCSTDYRRAGRLWLKAEEVLARRRQYRTFYVPAVADEFLYYLVKKVLKREITAEQLRRLRALYLSSPEECCAQMRRFWPGARVRKVVAAMLESDVWKLRWLQPELRAELLASEPVEGWQARAAQQVRECRRWAERVMHPTGLSIAICGGSRQQRDVMANGLERNLRPAFRRTRSLDEGGLGPAMWQWVSQVRSTLLLHQVASSWASTFARHQIRFELSETPPDVESATRAALAWMEERLERQMNHAAPE